MPRNEVQTGVVESRVASKDECSSQTKTTISMYVCCCKKASNSNKKKSWRKKDLDN